MQRVICSAVLVMSIFASLGFGQGTVSNLLKPGEPAKKLRIVFFGAHCDDNELGAGGLMRILADQGHEVISAYATTFRRGRMIQGQPEDRVRRAESAAACKILGATPHFFSFAHEELEKPFADKKTLAEIVDWFNTIQPDIVVAHWPLDTHPNHQVVGASAWMAYQHRASEVDAAQAPSKQPKSWNLYFYEVNTFTDFSQLQTLGFQPNGYVDVGQVHARKKQAIDCLQSQDPKILWGIHDHMHQQRGAECGRKCAEAYYLVEAKPGCPLLPVQMIQRHP